MKQGWDIVSLCEQEGLPTPQFAQDAFFKVTIYRMLKATESNNDKFGQSNKEGNTENSSVNSSLEDIHGGINSKQSNKESNIESNIGNIESNIDSLTYQQQTVINFCYVPRTSTEILQRLGLTRQTKNIKTYITDLVAMGFLRMIDPEHPRSKNQKYLKA